MAKLTKEQLVMISAACVALVAVALYIFLFNPLIIELRTAYAEFKEYDMELRNAHATIKGAKRIDTKKVFITDKVLITEDDISGAIAELTKQKNLYDINFVSITPGLIEKQKDPRYEIMPIELKTLSTYENLGTFLGLLDDLEEGLITLRSFKISPDKDNQARLRADLTLNLCILSRDEE